MRTAIVTDSNSGIFEKEGRELGIRVVPGAFGMGISKKADIM